MNLISLPDRSHHRTDGRPLGGGRSNLWDYHTESHDQRRPAFGGQERDQERETSRVRRLAQERWSGRSHHPTTRATQHGGSALGLLDLSVGRQRYLVDFSALSCWQHPRGAVTLDELSDRGLLAVCAAVELDVVHQARTLQEAQRARSLLRSFDWLPMPDEIWDRAVEVRLRAIQAGTHRPLSLTQLAIAATAEHHNVILLHYDRDFDLIAAITGQPSVWVVAPGTIT